MSVLLSTGDIGREYEVIELVFASALHNEMMESSLSVEHAFEGVKVKLQEKCIELGGDAVVFCQFNHRQYKIDSFGKKLYLEVFVYGTVVKFK